MRHSIVPFVMSLGIVALSQTTLHAQQTGSSTTPDGEAVPPPPSAPAATCTPICRSGYTCIEGTCVSQCNPPCGPGERCSGGECFAPPRAAPPGELDWGSAPPREGVEAHDGFMLRLAIGIGYGAVTESVSGGAGTFKLTGAAGSFSIDVGAAVAENAVIHARLADFFEISPHVTLDGHDQGDAENVSVGGVFVGPAFTYYLMPVNVYLTGAVGLSWIRASNADRNTSYTSNLGFGLNADIGKEWWVSDSWGLGVAGRFWYTRAPDEEDGFDIKFNMTGFAILFSATYQ